MKRFPLIALGLLSCALFVTLGLRRNHGDAETTGAPLSKASAASSAHPSGGSQGVMPKSVDSEISSGRTNEGSSRRETVARATKSGFNETHPMTKPRSRPRSNKVSAADQAAAPGPQESDELQAVAEETKSPLGVRLATNVRLPAAAMPNDLKLTEVSRKALQDILDDYYRELALGIVPEEEAADPEMNPPQTGRIETADNGERTLIVTNGPVADAARKRADQRFRALFGNAAYNRITMHAQMELLMSADAGR